MKPIKLTLKGFSGIASGRSKDALVLDLESIIPVGAQMVAIAGPNGSGKTTIIDNLHPYRLMPSKVSAPTPSAFSFYDHMVGGEAAKELIWEHEGVRYLSSIRMRATAKTKRQEAYLFEIGSGGETQPWSCTEAGLCSDGKTDNYDQCVEAILGKPEVFFAAQFSAQGKTPISKMAPAEIKKLLAQMLHCDDIAGLAGKASDVFKRLKPFMSQQQDQAMRIRQSLKDLDTLHQRIQERTMHAEEIDREIKAQSDEILNLTLQEASISGAIERQVAIKAQHDAVDEQLAAAKAEAQRQKVDLESKHKEEAVALTASEAEALRAIEMGESLIKSLRARSSEIDLLLGRSEEVEAAVRRMDKLVSDRNQKMNAIEDKEPELNRIEEIRDSISSLASKIERLASDGQHMAAALEIAKHSAALMDEVPCKGTTLAGECKLLCQAREAAASVSVQVEKIQLARNQYRAQSENHKINARVLESLMATEKQVKVWREELARIDADIVTCREVLGVRRSLDAARQQAPQLRAELARASEQAIQSDARLKDVQRQIKQLRARQEQEHQSLSGAHEKSFAQLMTVKSRLPALVDPASQGAVQERLQQCHTLRQTASERASALESEINALKVDIDLTIERQREAERHEATALAISSEMARWTLLAKALGNDGVIAMSIDDAGPAISSLANSLLDECYGGRFVIALKTQEPTAAGLQREVFNVEVEDTHRGESKLLDDMSGGEKVWINECLVRALALYMVNTGNARYETLFSDESDGPLDPERKRQYMGMKRKILDVGGYSREYLITQTPELLSMCDAVIDVAEL